MVTVMFHAVKLNAWKTKWSKERNQLVKYSKTFLIYIDFLVIILIAQTLLKQLWHLRVIGPVPFLVFLLFSFTLANINIS